MVIQLDGVESNIQFKLIDVDSVSFLPVFYFTCLISATRTTLHVNLVN